MTDDPERQGDRAAFDHSLQVKSCCWRSTATCLIHLSTAHQPRGTSEEMHPERSRATHECCANVQETLDCLTRACEENYAMLTRYLCTKIENLLATAAASS